MATARQAAVFRIEVYSRPYRDKFAGTSAACPLERVFSHFSRCRDAITIGQSGARRHPLPTRTIPPSTRWRSILRKISGFRRRSPVTHGIPPVGFIVISRTVFSREMASLWVTMAPKRRCMWRRRKNNRETAETACRDRSDPENTTDFTNLLTFEAQALRWGRTTQLACSDNQKDGL